MEGDGEAAGCAVGGHTPGPDASSLPSLEEARIADCSDARPIDRTNTRGARPSALGSCWVRCAQTGRLQLWDGPCRETVPKPCEDLRPSAHRSLLTPHRQLVIVSARNDVTARRI